MALSDKTVSVRTLMTVRHRFGAVYCLLALRVRTLSRIFYSEKTSDATLPRGILCLNGTSDRLMQATSKVMEGEGTIQWIDDGCGALLIIL